MSTDAPPRPAAREFATRYQDSRDPWDFATSPDECSRYATILAALPRSRYGNAFEPGCSVGELTARLAPLCDRVIATDVAPSAVMLAQRRCAALPNVEIECADIATDRREGPFDLIIFSDIGYYFPVAQLLRIAVSLARRLRRGGDLLAAHRLGDSADHVLHGDVVHASLLAGMPLRWLQGARHDGCRVDSWRRP